MNKLFYIFISFIICIFGFIGFMEYRNYVKYNEILNHVNSIKEHNMSSSIVFMTKDAVSYNIAYNITYYGISNRRLDMFNLFVKDVFRTIGHKYLSTELDDEKFINDAVKYINNNESNITITNFQIEYNKL